MAASGSGHLGDEPASLEERRSVGRFPAFQDAVVIDGSVAPEDMLGSDHLARMRASGVTAFIWTVTKPEDSLAGSLSDLVRARREIEAHAEEVMLVRSPGDLAIAKSTGRTGLIIGPQNAQFVAESEELFELLHLVGVRVLQLTYNTRTAFGDGCIEPRAAGLSGLGRRAVAALNELGIAVDVSHASEPTALDVLECAQAPVLLSHANPSSVFTSPRNVSDVLIREVAASGGVVGVCLWSALVGAQPQLGGRPTIDDYLRHLAHVVDLVGAEHVGVSSDHGEGRIRATWTPALSSGGDYPSVTAGLADWYGYDSRSVRYADGCEDWGYVAARIAALGFSDAELQGILGGNMARVLEACWK